MSQVPNQSPNVLTASGAIALNPGKQVFSIHAAAAITPILPLPLADGQEVVFIDETGHAHIVQCDASPGDGLNAANGYLTFNGTAGSSVQLIGRNNRWYTSALNGVTVT